jgi:hypothetical protein
MALAVWREAYHNALPLKYIIHQGQRVVQHEVASDSSSDEDNKDFPFDQQDSDDDKSSGEPDSYTSLDESDPDPEDFSPASLPPVPQLHDPAFALINYRFPIFPGFLSAVKAWEHDTQRVKIFKQTTKAALYPSMGEHRHGNIPIFDLRNHLAPTLVQSNVPASNRLNLAAWRTALADYTADPDLLHCLE